MFTTLHFGRKTVDMNDLSERLMIAVGANSLEEVKVLLEKGADVNKVCSSGRTALGVAAQLGKTTILELMLRVQNPSNHQSTVDEARENKDTHKHKVRHKKRKDQAHSCHRHNSLQTKENWKTNIFQHMFGEGEHHQGNTTTSNLGYFTVIHDELSTGNASGASAIASDQNSNKEKLNSSEMNDVTTPDGMEHLEWDTEIEDGNNEKKDKKENSRDDDVWTALFRWYADILDRTGAFLPSLPECNFSHRDAFGRMPVHYAAEQGHLDVLRLLHSSGCGLDCVDSHGMTPLHLAVSSGHYDVTKMLLELGVEVNSKTSDKASALHIAASRGYIEFIKLLLDKGANIESTDSSDRTPLYLAVSRNNEEAVAYLIEHGAKVNNEEIHGYTPLWEAVCQKNLTTTKMLLEAGARVTQSHHLLHFAVLHRHMEMVELLLDAGCIVNLRDDCGNTPLGIAAQTGHYGIAEMLLKKGAGVNNGNAVNGYTPLHEAAQLGNFSKFKKMYDLLREYGAKLNAQSYTKNDTPLFQALVANNFQGAALMIRHGIDVNLYDPDSIMVNVLFLACQKNYFPVVKLLVYAGFNLQGHAMLQNVCSTDTDNVCGWLAYMRCNPMSLSEICRIVIRRQFGENVYKCINNMCLPRQIRTFLLLEDITLEE